MSRSSSKQNGYRLVPLEERQQLRDHLKRLTETDRRTRFDPGIDADDFRQHFTRTRPVHEVVGWFENGVLRGAVEIYYRDDTAEAGLTLEEVYRGKGIAVELVRHALRQAGSHGARSLSMPFIRGSRSMTEIVAMLSSPESFGRWRKTDAPEPGSPVRGWIEFDAEDQAEPPPPGGLFGWLRNLLARRRG
jgi:GNAT superfamily N-acetyltransferase